MKRRAPLAALLIGVVLAGFVAFGFVRAASGGPNLGEPVVVSGTPVGGTGPTAERAGGQEPGRTGSPAATALPTATGSPITTGSPAATATATATAAAGATASPSAEAERPSPRRTRAEPVKPPSPRLGGDDDDGGDDRDDGNDDD